MNNFGLHGLQMKYFVLNPNKNDLYGKASRNAILTYAGIIGKENPMLYDNLIEWISILEKELKGDQ